MPNNSSVLTTKPAAGKSLALLLLCGSIILTLSMGVRHSVGLFLQPMTQAHGWSRELFSFAVALQNLIWGLASPFTGGLADRYGAVRTIIVCTGLYVLGLVLMASAESGLGLSLSTGLLVGLGLSGVTFTVVMGVVGRHVAPEKRTLAMGVIGAGGSFGQFAVLPLGQSLINGYGWHSALLVLAALLAVMALLSFALAEAPRSPAAGSEQTVSEALREVGVSRAFHYLFWGYFVCGFQTAFVMLHLPAFLVDSGFSPTTGMTAVALIGLFNIFGSFLFGWAGGRYSKKNLLALIYWGRIGAIALILLFPLSIVSIYLFAALMGLLWLATVPLTNGLVAQFFGVRYLSMLTGVVFLGHQLGSFLGAWLGGLIFDRSGSYLGAWLLAVALSLLAGWLSWLIREDKVASDVPVAEADLLTESAE